MLQAIFFVLKTFLLEKGGEYIQCGTSLFQKLGLKKIAVGLLTRKYWDFHATSPDFTLDLNIQTPYIVDLIISL